MESSAESSAGSSVESSVGSTVRSSMGSSVGSSDGSLVSLQDENARLRTEARRDSKRIEQLTGEVRMLTRAAAAVVVAARSCQVTLGTAAEGLSGMSVGSLVGSVRLGSSVSISSGSVRSAVSSVGSTGRSVGSTVGSVSFMLDFLAAGLTYRGLHVSDAAQYGIGG